MPETNIPLLDRTALERDTTYQPSSPLPDLPNIPFKPLNTPMPMVDGEPTPSALSAFQNGVLNASKGDEGKILGGSIPRSLKEVTSERYNNYVPGDYNNEDAYAQGQSWASKMVNGVGKGLVLTGTTFLQSTAGLVNGVVNAIGDGRAASFYDNDFNRALDEFNKKMEDNLPNYYKDVEKNSSWYSPSKLFTANFFWDGIIKNMGFAAGAALSGGVYASALKSLAATPMMARLFSVGKAAETLAATEEALLTAGKSAQVYGKVKELSDKFLGTYNFLNTGQRVLVAGLATTGEAGFEAYHNLNDFRNEKIQEYKDTHNGEEPLGEDLEAINREADRVGNSSFILNTALLTATNYIQFPKILGSSYKSEKGIINGLAKETDEIIEEAGKYTTRTAKTKSGKLFQTIGKVAPYTFSAPEAFEEGAQFAISVGTKDYYDKAYKGESNDFFESVVESIEGTLGTNEGMENVLIGGLSGALMTAKGRFQEGLQKNKNTAEALQAFNNWKLSDFTKETVNAVNRGTAIQEDREKALRQGDILESKDLEADYIINYLTPRIKYGRFDLIAADIAEYRALASTDKGFAQLQAEGKALEGDTRQQYLKRLENLAATAESIKSLHQSITLRYGNLVKDGKPLYSNEVVDKMIYAATKVADYDNRIPELSNSLILNGIDGSAVVSDSILGNTEKLAEAKKAINELKVTSDVKEDLIQNLEDLVEVSLRRDLFLKEYDQIKKSPESYKEAQKVEIEPEKLGQKIETEEGEEPLEVGVEYYVEKEIEVKELDKPIKKYSRFTVLKEEDDQVLVQASDGKKFKIAKDKFKNFKTFKVSSAKSENAVIFIESSDSVFTYNKGKGADNPKGRISYRSADDSLWFESLDGKEKIRITREDLVPGINKKTGKKYDVAKVFSSKKFTEKAEAALKVPVTLDEKLASRNKIVADLYTENKAELEDVNRAIVKTEKALEAIQEKIKEETYTKKGTLRKQTNKIRTSINALIQEKATLEKQLASLRDKKESLESTMTYLDDLIDNVRELPEDSKDLLGQLKEDVRNLEELIDSTQKSIDKSISLLVSLEDAIKSAFKYLDKLVSDFKAKNPRIPMDLDALQTQVEAFLGEKGAEDYIKNKEGFTQTLLDFQELLADQEAELNIPDMQKQASALLEKIDDSIEKLKDLKKEHAAKEVVLEKFKAVAEKFQREQAEQERLRKNEALRAELLGSEDPSLNIRSDNQNYEPESKKTTIQVVTSTKPTDSDRPHHVRANKFGINFPRFSQAKKAKIKAVLVSAKNEAELGLKGLTQYLIDQSDAEPSEKATADPNKSIVMVFVKDMGPGKKPVPVDENGEELVLPTLENAVYQVMPDPSLKWSKKYGEKSMFRKGTAQEVIDHYRKQYTDWVESVLASPSMDMYDFDPSFGRPEYVMIKDSEGKESRDYTAVVTVEESGLVTKSELNGNATPLITIPTTNTAVTTGSMTLNSPLGRPLLKIGGVLVPLQNRLLTKRESETIFKAILQLASIINKKGTIKNEEGERLVDWLRSIVYWGKPKHAAGFNSIFFESTPEGLMLKMSGKNAANFPFTVDGLTRNKTKILALLEGMYNNVQSGKVNKDGVWDQPYYEIIDIKEDGTPEYREWANYQTYLLSREGRKDNEIPLFTNIRPLKDSNDVNRKSVYFTLKNSPKTYTEPETKAKLIPVQTPTPIAKKEEAPEPKKEAPVAKTEEFVLDGKTENTFTMSMGSITFTATSDIKKTEDGVEYVDLSAWPSNNETAKAFEDKYGSKEKAAQIIGAVANKKIIESIKAKEAPKPMENPKPEEIKSPVVKIEKQEEKPVSDIEAKKADIETKLGIKLPIKNTSVPVSSKTWGDRKSLANQLSSELKGVVERGVSIQEWLDKGYGRQLATWSDETITEFLEVSDIERRRQEDLREFGSTGWGDHLKQPFLEKFGVEVNGWMSDTTSTFMGPNPKNDKFTVFDLRQIINAKYDAELDALNKENKTIEPAKISLDERLKKYKKNAADNTPFGGKTNARVRIKERFKKFKKENWAKTEAWLKENFPNVPVYRIKNAIKASNGQELWGMLQEGAIYVYENAEVGTVYHEVFEAVWKMFSDPTEQKAIIDEFRNRSGSFVDRPTGQTIAYSKATSFQIKEQLAEEFRDYVLYKKIPVKPKDGRPWIVKLFSDLVNAIKSLFIGKEAQTKVGQMFKKIGTGYYKTTSPYENSLAMASQGVIDRDDVVVLEGSDYRIANIPADKVNEVMQHMTYTTLQKMIKGNQSLFNIVKINKSVLYEELRENLYNTLAIPLNAADDAYSNNEISEEERNQVYTEITDFITRIDNEWESIQAKHEEYLASYDIEFDENDETSLKGDEKSKEDPYGDATKIDSFKKANGAVKLLLSTLPYLESDGTTKFSSINGVQLLPASRVFISVMNNVHTSRSVDEMIKRVGEMAEKDINYSTLYNALTKLNDSLSEIDNSHDAQLLAAFWRTFKKQSPEVKNVYIFENGDVEVGDSNLTTAANQISTEFSTNLVSHIKEGKSKYFTYSKKDNAYIGDPKAIKDLKLDSVEKRVAFLKQFGINFTSEEIFSLSDDRFESFIDAVDGIRKSIEDKEKIVSVSNKILDIKGRIKSLSTLRASIDNPEFDSTFFNVKGERTQTFIGTNAASDLYDNLSQVNNIKDLLNTQYAYLLTDSFAQGSVILESMFDLTDPENNPNWGNKKPKASQYLRSSYADGTVNQANGKKKQTSKLSYKERLAQELTPNAKGFYYSLVPGDATIQWMSYMGNKIKPDLLLHNFSSVHNVFKGYFLSEVSLARENRTIVKPKNSDRNPLDLRFFKDILNKYQEGLHDEIMGIKGDKKKIKRNVELSPELLYKEYEDKINSAVEAHIKRDASVTFKVLQEYGLVVSTENGYELRNMELNTPASMEEGTLMRHLIASSANFTIANIESHKLLYSDPYQYEDELKRIKNFNSPRQAVISNSPQMNAALNKIWNKGFEGIGETNFIRDYFRTATLKDIVGTINLPGYKPYKETDGSGIISLKALRNFRIRAGEWNDAEEAQYKYDIAFEKKDKGQKLTKEEQDIYNNGNPDVKSVYTPIKPIVSGNKVNNRPYNDILLDKFALYPLSYRILKDLAANGKTEDVNALKLYNKMQREDIDYVVFKSGRKVGAEQENSVYNPDGSFNNLPFVGIVNTPFSIISIQAEVPSKENAKSTRGSQATKLVTLDFMEAGVPADFMPGGDFEKRYKEWSNLAYKGDYEGVEKGKPNLYTQIKENQKLLEEGMKASYAALLKRLGMREKVDGTFEIVDFKESAILLRNEVIKREVNDNISDAMQGFIDGDTTIEATPAFQQIRNILYSIADKEVISPKITGGQKVQIPSSLLEVNRVEGSEKGFTSDVLKFYEDKDGQRVCEVMIGRWFDSDKSDAELIEYFNNTEEGQKVISGIGFRIPTQKQNSIDVFRIKQFLPRSFGDSVVVPSALVEKAGSDFDIDKLSLYLKSVYTDLKGNIKEIPFLGYGEKAKEGFKKMFDDGAFLSEKQRKTFKKWLENRNLEEVDRTAEQLLRAAFGIEAWEESFLLEIVDDLLDVKNISEIRDKVVDKIYKQSLENAYIDSMISLVSHPLNFKSLIKPNSADQMKNLATDITKKLGFDAFDYASAGNMLSRHFMSRLRHAFVSGKYAIGIAAVNQTNHSLNQRQAIYIDPRRWDLLSEEDKYWLSGGTGNREDATLKFKHFNKITIDGKKVPTFSMVKSAVKGGDAISDVIAQFIDGYVDISKGPWIMELGATPNVASTWLTLIKLGVPVEEVAYFMNQPIVKDYLASIEKDGYSWLFMKNYVSDLKESEKYSTDQVYDGTIPSLTSLKATVGLEKLSDQQKAEQQFILDEFLKYAKLSEQMFHVTQGSNFDTATFNDPLLIYKKQKQFEKAQNTIISSVEELVENSFLGEMQNSLLKIRNAMAEFLPSDKIAVRSIVEKALEPHIDLSDYDFVKIGQKVIGNLFDFAVQTNPSFVANIQEILLSDNNTAKQISDFIAPIKADPEHPLHKNQIVQSLVKHSSSVKGGVNVVKIKNKDNKVYDQNQMIYSFIELKNYLQTQKNPELYDKLLLLAMLQSGLSKSPISFTTMLPYQDFKKLYNETLSKLEKIPNLGLFNTLNVLERTNWNDDDIVPYVRAKRSRGGNYNRNMTFDKNLTLVGKAIDAGKLPKLVKINSLSGASDKDIIVYTWEKMSDIWSPEEVEQFKTGGTVMGYKTNIMSMYNQEWIKEKKSRMRKEGDYSYIQKGLFKKVYKGGEPLVNEYEFNGIQREYIYKAINAWGDSHMTDGNYFSANEFYNTAKMSPIENGFIKVESEMSDDTISAYFDATVKPSKKDKGTTELPECA